ncbi:MAG: hypothetical protein J6S36_00850 [Eggerthellaceae bacterium]|nr:hypothetical protein [Eggerthellaceae bacterium]
MSFETREVEALCPYHNADSGLIDADSGMRLFRGITSPWGAIKGFKEAYDFAMRMAALHAVSMMNTLKIVEPDYETRQNAMTAAWEGQAGYLWGPDDPFQLHQWFREAFDIPPFLKDGVYLGSMFADYGDSIMTMTGHIRHATNDLMEKEIHHCPLDIIGPDACDLSIAGGAVYCAAVSHCGMNFYLSERRGRGDAYCLAHNESVKKYGPHQNADGYDWERFGPPTAASRDPKDGHEHIDACDFFRTGEYVSPLGAVITDGTMYSSGMADALGYSGHAVQGMRVLIGEDQQKWQFANNAMEVIYEAAGKNYFGDRVGSKAVRDWMGVPSDVKDGRVLGSFISMILQALSIDSKIVEFEEERTVIDASKAGLEASGQYPEFDRSWYAYFNGMAKTLVSSEWSVVPGEYCADDRLQFVIRKGKYGYQRNHDDAQA